MLWLYGRPYICFVGGPKAFLNYIAYIRTEQIMEGKNENGIEYEYIGWGFFCILPLPSCSFVRQVCRELLTLFFLLLVGFRLNRYQQAYEKIQVE